MYPFEAMTPVYPFEVEVGQSELLTCALNNLIMFFIYFLISIYILRLINALLKCIEVEMYHEIRAEQGIHYD